MRNESGRKLSRRKQHKSRFLWSHLNNPINQSFVKLPAKFQFDSIYSLWLPFFKKLCIYSKYSESFPWMTMSFNLNSCERFWNGLKIIISLKNHNKNGLLMYGVFAFHCLWGIVLLLYYSVRCRTSIVQIICPYKCNLSSGNVIDYPSTKRKSSFVFWVKFISDSWLSIHITAFRTHFEPVFTSYCFLH